MGPSKALLAATASLPLAARAESNDELIVLLKWAAQVSRSGLGSVQGRIESS